ncbi:MAG: DUF177 domain-containing protein [Acidobacteriota bacterium]
MEIRLDRLDAPHTWRETLHPLMRAAAGDDVPTGETDAPLIVEHPDIASLAPIDCRGRLLRTPAGLYLHLAFDYTQSLRCTRCLSVFDVDVRGTLDLMLVLAAEVTAASGEDPHDQALTADELGVLYLDEPVLDSADLVREQIHLHVPMMPLCKSDCAGLCSTCGADLNDGDCGCDAEVDPRWAGLMQLRLPSDPS